MPMRPRCNRSARALVVQGEASCPEQEPLASEIAKWLERDLIARSIGIVVDRHSEGIDVLLLWNGDVLGRRSFPSAVFPSTAACPQLTRALGLAIALAIDATARDVQRAPHGLRLVRLSCRHGGSTHQRRDRARTQVMLCRSSDRLRSRDAGSGRQLPRWFLASWAMVRMSLATTGKTPFS